MKKKIISVLLAMAMVTVCFVGCGEGQKQSELSGEKEEDKTVVDNSSEEASNVWNETGYPIVNEPITLTIGVKDFQDASQGQMEDLDWVKALQEESGITFEFVKYNDETLNLMWASQDYPDILFGLGASVGGTILSEAIKAGDLVALDEYFEQYAPNWSAYLAEDANTTNIITNEDGHIYGLPMVRQEPANYAIRDQWCIRKSWLDELGLEVPTTTEEFYDVLVAFRDNAGKGSIPEDVIPYYAWGVQQWVGSAQDLINSFGVRVSGERGILTVDDNGQVECNWANEAIKAPLEYIHKLVEEGLIPRDAFVDSAETYYAKVNAPNVGVWHSYHVQDPTLQDIVFFGPLDAENGEKPMMRAQTNIVTPNMFMVFSDCEYPEVAVRLANMIAEADWSVQGMWGMADDTFITRESDGSLRILPYESGAQSLTSSPGAHAPLLLAESVFETTKFSEGSNQYTRSLAAEHYKEYSIPQKNLWPNFAISEANLERLSELSTDVNAVLWNAINSFCLDGGIEEGWDAYIAELESAGFAEYLELMQEELDAFRGN